jgi:hypothetical protein
MATEILIAGARLDDSTAMDALIAPIPNSEQLRQILSTGSRQGLYHVYDAETRTARYIASDGRGVLRFTVTDLTPEQAATIAAECRDITVWNGPAFQTAVERALGVSFDRVQ